MAVSSMSFGDGNAKKKKKKKKRKKKEKKKKLTFWNSCSATSSVLTSINRVYVMGCPHGDKARRSERTKVPTCESISTCKLLLKLTCTRLIRGFYQLRFHFTLKLKLNVHQSLTVIQSGTKIFSQTR
jgi:hypothetical protein